jgi:hypothetical protein
LGGLVRGGCLALILTFSLWSAVVPAVLAQDQGPQQATVTVESKEIRQGREDTISVTVSGVPGDGLVSFQGTLTYDPAVIEVLSVEFPDGFPVWAANIEAGTVRFAATTKQTRTPVKEGELFTLMVRAIGEPESSTILTPAFEIFHGLDFSPIDHITVEGTVTIVPSVNELPIADFEFSPTGPSTRDVIQFTDKSSDPDGQIVSWLWDFGDGTTSEEPSPTHQYSQGGTYTVKLTVTDDREGTNTATVRFYVFQAPPPSSAAAIAFPNPAKTQAKFRYFLPEGATQATLLVFDLRGRPVLARELDVGGQVFIWDLRDDRGNALQNGPYFYLVRAITPQGVIRSRVEVLIIQR